MAVLHLVRHGQAGGAGYDELTDLGVEQARAVGAELRRRAVRPARVVTGGLWRQQQTAAEMGFADAEVDARWNEYDHLALLAAHGGAEELTGRLASSPDPGRTLQYLLDGALETWIAAPDPDRYAESWPAFRDRVGGALSDVDGDTLVVTSAGPISAVTASLLGVPPEGWLALNRVTVNTGITTVVLGRRGASLVSFNDHAHVAGDGRRLLTYR